MRLFPRDADVVMVTSENALLRGPRRGEGLSSPLREGAYHVFLDVGPPRGVSASGTVGWLLAEGTESAAQGDREEKHPYRMSMVCEKRDGRWLLLQVPRLLSAPRIAPRRVGQALIQE
jgi:hypothetical protein